MAKYQRPTVALLFLGGSLIDERGRRGDQVQAAADVEPWMTGMSEVDIIAETKGFFIASGKTSIGLKDWAAVAACIKKEYGHFQGFVVVHDLATIGAAAVVLSVMLGNLEKPVVLVGSPLRPKGSRQAGPSLVGGQEFGAKASMINAVQVATADAAEVLVVFGSTIFRGREVIVTAGTHPTLTGPVLGKIDFGIRLFGEQVRRRARTFRVYPNFDTDVAVVDYLPGLSPEAILHHTAHHHSFFLSSTEGMALTDDFLRALVQELKGRPLALYDPTGRMQVSSTILILRDQSRTAALLRYMWALGQTHDQRRLKKLLGGKEDR